MSRFMVATEGGNIAGLREACQAFVDSLWIPAHLTAEQAAAFALECFRRTVAGELELLAIVPTNPEQR